MQTIQNNPPHPPQFYSALLLFQSLRNGLALPENLWEESLILVQAPCEQTAREAATQIGQARGTVYPTASGDTLEWVFFGIERIFQLETPPRHGGELFSRHLRSAEVQSLLTDFDD